MEYKIPPIESMADELGFINAIVNEEIAFRIVVERSSDQQHYRDIIKRYQFFANDINEICVCTLEAITGRSHFFCSALLYMLQSFEKVEQYRLGKHRDRSLRLPSNDLPPPPLFSEPLYVINFKTQSETGDFSSQMDAMLKAVGSIIAKYARKDNADPNSQGDRHHHPYIVYWKLIKELKAQKQIEIPISTACRYHSTQGLISLDLLYLMVLKETGDNLILDTEKLLSYYDEFAQESAGMVEILPEPARFETDDVFNLLQAFFFSASKGHIAVVDRLLSLARLTNLALQVLRPLSEYVNTRATAKIPRFIEMMDHYLRILYEESKTNENAKYYYVDYWKQKCALLKTLKLI